MPKPKQLSERERGKEVEEVEELIALAIRFWALKRSSVDKNRYLVKQLDDQSPAACTIKTVPPHA